MKWIQKWPDQIGIGEFVDDAGRRVIVGEMGHVGADPSAIALVEDVDEMLSILRQCEWGTECLCISCGGPYEFHCDGCRLAALLERHRGPPP